MVVQDAAAQNAAAKAKKIQANNALADAAFAETAGRGLGERELRKRANASSWPKSYNLLRLFGILALFCLEAAFAHPANATVTVDAATSRSIVDGLKPAMSLDEEQLLQRIYSTTLNRTRILRIEASLAFGTILGQARHGKRMPWDDDLDLMMDEADLPAFVRGLTLIKAERAPWCVEPFKCDFKPPRQRQRGRHSERHSVCKQTIWPLLFVGADERDHTNVEAVGHAHQDHSRHENLALH